jgi:hypothetical protein
MIEQYNELGEDGLRAKIKAKLQEHFEAGDITGREFAGRISQLDEEIAEIKGGSTSRFEVPTNIDWSKNAAEKGDSRVADGHDVSPETP